MELEKDKVIIIENNSSNSKGSPKGGEGFEGMLSPGLLNGGNI